MMASFSTSDFFAPLVLLVVGAILTGLLVPYVTRRWQDHQKELELKADLLARMSEAVTRVITHAWFRELGGKEELSQTDREEFDWRYGEWEVETRVIQAQFEAYFARSPDIARHWATYCDLLRELHHLSWERMKRGHLLARLNEAYDDDALWAVKASKRRPLLGWKLSRVESFAGRHDEDVNWSAFEDTDNRIRYMGQTWRTLKGAMEQPRIPLAQAILFASIESL
jgi:hypothetical protein